MSQGRRPQRVWFTNHWDPDKEPEHIVKAVVRYNPHSRYGNIVHTILKGIALLLQDRTDKARRERS